MRHSRWLGPAALLVALGCEQPLMEAATTASSKVESSGDEPGETGSAETGHDDTGEPTGGELELHCSPWDQNCPGGQKCVLYSKDGGPELDAARCIAMPPAPRRVDESCVVDGGYGTGLDDCDAGLMCWDVGPSDQGVCVPICNGCAPDPQCPEGRLCASGNGNFHYMCLPACDPLLQDCIEGNQCVLGDEGFVCAPDVSGPEGQIYDDCTRANGCDHGLMCAPPDAAPGCTGSESAGCCLPFCVVGGTTCPDDLQCVMLFDPETHPQYAEVGFCTAAP